MEMTVDYCRLSQVATLITAVVPDVAFLSRLTYLLVMVRNH